MKVFIETNEQLQELTQAAIENWTLDSETDPDDKIAKGLEVIASGEVTDEEVKDVFQVDKFPKSFDKWSALEDWAKRLV